MDGATNWQEYKSISASSNQPTCPKQQKVPQIEHRDEVEIIDRNEDEKEVQVVDDFDEIMEIKPDPELSLRDGPLSALWKRGKTKPLLEPKDATSTPEILDKIALTPTFESKPPIGAGGGDLRVSYDVYRPGRPYKKSNPGIPDYRLAILPAERKLPSIEQLAKAQSDESPLLMARVSPSGTVAFFTMANISLPVDVTIG